MKVLLIGANGQIGQELIYTCPEKIKLFSYKKHLFDITNKENIKTIVNKHAPDIVINAAAYTSVEEAENNKILAYKVNKEGVSNIAHECSARNIRLIHYSTDYVFDGHKTSPYTPQDETKPLNVYGKSKLEGEKEALLINSNKTLIIRTSWIYSKHGNNFVKTMLVLLKKGNDIEVIRDQIGTPTWARSIANITWECIKNNNLNGIIHYCDNGTTNWYEFARTIQDIALQFEIISNRINIKPISSKQYKSKVNRPAYSVLDCSQCWQLLNVIPDSWETSLYKMLRDYKFN